MRSLQEVYGNYYLNAGLLSGHSDTEMQPGRPFPPSHPSVQPVVHLGATQCSWYGAIWPTERSMYSQDGKTGAHDVLWLSTQEAGRVCLSSSKAQLPSQVWYYGAPLPLGPPSAWAEVWISNQYSCHVNARGTLPCGLVDYIRVVGIKLQNTFHEILQFLLLMITFECKILFVIFRYENKKQKSLYKKRRCKRNKN